MDIRTPFSRLKKKVKHRLAGNKPNPNKAGSNVSGERLDPMSSFLHPESDAIAGGREGYSADSRQTRSTDRLLQPAGGGENDQEAESDGGGTNPGGSHLLSTADVVVRTGLGQEGKDIDEEKADQAYHHSSPNLSITYSGEREGT